MLTQDQIKTFKIKARAKGFSEAQIAQEIARKQQEETRIQLQNRQAPVQQMQMQQPVAPVAPKPQPIPKKGNLLGDIVGAVTKPAVDFGKFVGEAGYQLGRVATDPLYRKAITTGGQGMSADELAKASQFKSTQFVKPEQIQNRAKTIETGARKTAGAMSYAIPGGVGVKAGLKAGAISGALFGASEDGAGVNEILSSATGGAAGGALIPAGGKFLKGAYSKLVTKPGEALADAAAQRIHKASPSMWQKAVEQHGLDLGALTKKYFPKGGTYDDILGPVKERGKGGIFKKKISEAEQQIADVLKSVNKNTVISIDDMVKELQKEARALSKMPGNEKNIDALNAFVEGFKTQYSNGINPRRLLELKRIADSKFGAAVADETTGAATAQAQKMIANMARKKLKKLIPEIKDALDTETEIYTLQPVLNRARGIINTQGSEIRVGSLKGKGLFDMILALPEKYMSDPKNASKFLDAQGGFLNQMGQGLSKGADAISTSTANVVGRTAGAAAMTPAGTVEQYQQEEPNVIQDSYDYGQDYNQEDNLQQDTAIVHPIFGSATKREVLLDAFQSGLNQKQLQEIESLYDQFSSEEDQAQLSDQFLETGEPVTRADKMWMLENPDKVPGRAKTGKGAGTEKERMFQNAGFAAQQALDLLEGGEVSSGIGQGLIGGIGEKLGTNSETQQRYRSSLALARTAARNALLGANMTEKEMESIKAFIPEFDDAPSTAREKLNTFINLMNQFSGQGNLNVEQQSPTSVKKKTVEPVKDDASQGGNFTKEISSSLQDWWKENEVDAELANRAMVKWANQEELTPEEQKSFNKSFGAMQDIAFGGTTAVKSILSNADAQFFARLGQAMDKGYMPKPDEVDKILKTFRSTLGETSNKVSSAVGKRMSSTSIEEMVANIRGLIDEKQAYLLGETDKSPIKEIARFIQGAAGKMKGSKPKPKGNFEIPQIKPGARD